MNDIKKSRDHLKEWLDRQSKASKLVPVVKGIFDQVDWEYRVSSEDPTEVQPHQKDLDPLFEQQYRKLIKVLPLTPNLSSDDVAQLATSASSAATVVYGTMYLNRDTTGFNSGAARRHIDEYQQLQDHQLRRSEVRSLLQEMAPGLTEQYARALESYDLARSGVADCSSAALEMRTLIDNVQGVLFNRARSRARENMTWEHMAERLCPTDEANTQHMTLLQQAQVRKDIIQTLSEILKRRISSDMCELEKAWTVALEHVYVVLRTIKEASHPIGIGGSLTAPPAHPTGRAGSHPASRLIRR